MTLFNIGQITKMIDNIQKTRNLFRLHSNAGTGKSMCVHL